MIEMPFQPIALARPITGVWLKLASAPTAKELGNPLAPICIGTAMLGRVRTDEPLLPRMQAIVEPQVTQMTRLVDDVLEVSRGKPSQAAPARRSIDMTEVTARAVTACRPVLDQRLQQLRLAVPAGPLGLDGEAPGLMQIVSNVVDNASGDTPDGGEIELSVVLGVATLTMTVTDSGIGVTVQALPDIFEPSVRDTSGLGFNGVGTGIA